MGGSPSAPKAPKPSKLEKSLEIDLDVEKNKPSSDSNPEAVGNNKKYVNDKRRQAISKSRSKSAKKAIELTGHNEQSRAARTPKNPHLKRAVKLATKGDDRR